MALVDTRATFADGLSAFGDAVALISGSRSVTYAELDALVVAMAARIGSDRRLVLLAADNSVESVVGYLGALRGRHPVIIGPRGDAAACRSLIDAYDPDVVIDAGTVVDRRAASRHELHPDLALLLSTSGSTGTPKLVRLSYENVASNAAAIGSYLDIAADDRAITTLPMYYCYGLSVLNSYLRAGAGVVISDLSVVDDCFWRLARENRVTSFAGVPHTFELLERVGFSGREVPTLRYLTQAGGRMAPERVARFAAIGAASGFDLFVMYGQTEATARMAYLPPALARSHPNAIGLAIPGGDLRIDASEGEPGELVYRGANVMLGYARTPADLALGRTIDELRTGDLALRTSNGLLEIVGRSSRVIKPFGIRIDLDDLERVLRDSFVESMCTGGDDRLVVGVASAKNAARAQEVIARRLHLPPSHVRVVELAVLPRLASDKADYRAVVAAADAVVATRGTTIRDGFMEAIGVWPDGTDSFASLGGDSLSYVELSISLEDHLGALPANWHLLPVAELESLARPGRRSLFAQVDTSVVLRALAIVLIVGSHTRVWRQSGGAHALVAVAGFNFARFQFSARSMAQSVARIAVPSMVCIGAMAVVGEKYGLTHALLVNDVLGNNDVWSFWFVEALVQTQLVLAAVFASPRVRRFERANPLLTAYLAVAVGLLFRFDVLQPTTDHWVWWPHDVFFLFALGWAAARAHSPLHRVAVSLLAAATVPGFFTNGPRGVIVVAAIMAIAWLPTVRVPRPLVPLVTPLAGASLYIYLTHIPLYPVVGRTFGPVAAALASLATGVAVWRLAQRIETRWSLRYGRVARAERTRNATGTMLTASNASAGSAAAS